MRITRRLARPAPLLLGAVVASLGILAHADEAASQPSAAKASFEADLDGTRVTGARAQRQRSAAAPDGNWVLALTSTARSTPVRVMGPRTGTGSQRRYLARASVRSRGAGSRGAPIVLRIEERDRAGALIRSVRTSARTTPAFRAVSRLVTPSRNARTLVLTLTVAGGSRTQIDQVELRPAPTSGGSQGIRDWESRPYGAADWLYEERPSPFPTDPRSRQFVAALLDSYRSSRPSMTAGDETPPVYEATPRDPRYTIRLTRFSSAMSGRRVRVPAGATAGGGADHPLIVLDPVHRTEARFWQAEVDHASRTVFASSGGLFRYGPRGDGRPFVGNGVGSGLSYLNGMIRPEDVRRGRIDHALRFAADFIDGRHRFPATRSDQSGSGGVPMGTRFYLNVTAAECDARTVPAGGPNAAGATRFLRMICHAIRRHGMYAADGAPKLVLTMENDTSAQWSRAGVEESFGNYGWIIRGQGTDQDGFGPRSATDGLPWDRLVARAAAGGGRY